MERVMDPDFQGFSGDYLLRFADYFAPGKLRQTLASAVAGARIAECRCLHPMHAVDRRDTDKLLPAVNRCALFCRGRTKNLLSPLAALGRAGDAPEHDPMYFLLARHLEGLPASIAPGW